MKAQFVYENLDFERGQDPKKGMNIGMQKAIDSILKDFLEYDANEDRFIILSINIYDGYGAEFVIDLIYGDSEEADNKEFDNLKKLMKKFELDVIFDMEDTKTIYNDHGVISMVFPFRDPLKGLFKNVSYLYDPNASDVRVNNITSI